MIDFWGIIICYLILVLPDSFTCMLVYSVSSVACDWNLEMVLCYVLESGVGIERLNCNVHCLPNVREALVLLFVC